MNRPAISIGRVATKILSAGSRGLRSLWYRHVALAWMTFGREVQFLGPIQCLGVTGSISIGERTVLGAGISLSVAAGGSITIGAGCSVNQGTLISSLTSVSIGSGTRIGEYCSIRDNDHRIEGTHPIADSGFRSKAVEIGENAWIGRNVTIMPGVRIGNGAVVGANSFVRSDVPDFTVVAGTPARVVRVRA